ncbi:MAG: heparan-alpha-glucosaminide N-acetyltransferase domain-containing protein, partial [Myxococcota bacterium]
GWQSPLDSGQLLYLVLTGDILQLAGLSLVLMGLARHFVSSPAAMMAVALVTASLGGVLRGYRPGVPGLDYVADLFWGAEWNVYFPVLPWTSIIVFGMGLGLAYRKSPDPDSIFRRMLPLGMVLFVIGGVLCLYDPTTHINDFFHLGPGGAIHLSGIAAILLWFSFVATPPVTATSWGYQLGRFLRFFSRRVTTFYVIHWVLICWGMPLLGYKTMSPSQVALLFVVFLGLTVGVDEGIRRLWRAARNPKKSTASTLAPMPAEGSVS